jgi:D-hydroxyproline dehydrogenase subunit alpha
VCRCEEVTLGRMREAAGLGADDARSIKLLARPGMGWCQGRICGPPVAALLAAGLGPAPAESAGQAPAAGLSRPLAQPVPLGVLARLAGLDEPSGAEATRPHAAGIAEAGAGETGARPDDAGKM